MNDPKKKVDDPVLSEIDELMDFDEPEKKEEKAVEKPKEKVEEPPAKEEESADSYDEKEDEQEQEQEQDKKEEDESNTDNDEDGDEEESDDEVLAQLNALAKENRQLRTGHFERTEVTKPAVKDEPPAEEKVVPKEEPKPAVEVPKGKLIFNSQDEYEKALGSYEDFNKVLLQNQSAVFEMVAQKLIPVIGKMIEDYIKNFSAVEKFYSEEKDLTPVKDLVDLEADKIRAKEPNLDTAAVLKKAGENARKIVGGYLKRSGKTSAKSAKPRLITPNGRASRPQKTVDLDPNSQEALMSDLL